MVTRRSFLASCGRSAGAAALGLGLADRIAWGSPSGGIPAPLPVWVGDVAGDGVYTSLDLDVVSAALASSRGRHLLPQPGFDYRADIFGDGEVDESALDAVRQTHDRVASVPDTLRPRPITVAWHYGWYTHANRPIERHHVWFKGGAYSSRDPEVEALFNTLKNEFGITVDALSWADPARDGNLNDNYASGYFRAANRGTRHTALLYESLISLKAKRGRRLDFSKRKVRKSLERNFTAMGRFLRGAEMAGGRLFRIHGRPVIFLYGSHIWGLDPMGPGAQHDLVDRAVEDAIAAFAAEYGSTPFLIGEEVTFVETDRFDGAHVRRTVNYDGIFGYHHAANPDFIVRGGQQLSGRYVEQVKETMHFTYEGIVDLRNRFTNQKILMVPSLAAGFSKRREPMLHASREQYTAFLQEMLAYHEDKYTRRFFGSSALAAMPPVVSVGSWNEEWEGHAIMPSRFNHTMAPRENGFDYVRALKRVFGWNHYAERAAPSVF